ncbi:MAG: cell surface protein SprA [Bacteroidota bacterium]
MLDIKCDTVPLLEYYDFLADYDHNILTIINNSYRDCDLTISVKPEGIFEYCIPGTMDLKSPGAWKPASIPKYQDSLFPEASYFNQAISNYNRACLAYYIIDPLFLRNNSSTPEHIKENPDEQSYHTVREIFEKEIFPDEEGESLIPTNFAVLNLAFYPSEKASYNFCYQNEYSTDSVLLSAGIDSDGKLLQPDTRWGGIMRPCNAVYEKEGITLLDVLMMDPYADDSSFHIVRNDINPCIYFNIGNISEDIYYDGKQSKENAVLCTSGNNLDSTAFGVLHDTLINTMFLGNCQDIGYDGLSDEEERLYFNFYISRLAANFGSSSVACQNAMEDPSNDNYHYYRGTDYDNMELSILDRYRYYCNADGNSPSSGQSPEIYPTSATSLPDQEDANRNFHFDTTEAYFQYKISLKPEDLRIGTNHIIDTLIRNVTFKNGKESQVIYYRLLLNLNEYDSKYGNIESLPDSSFLRIFVKGAGNDLFLRFVTMNLVFSHKERYVYKLNSEDKLLIYPNPSSGSFYLVSMQQVNYIQIYSLSGKEISYYFRTPYSGATPDVNFYYISLDNSISKGIYIIKAFFDTGSATKRIMITD